MGHRWLLALVLLLGLVPSQVPTGWRAASAAPDVAGTSYTSPQFGFQVSWAAPWTLAQEPVSKPRQYDVLSLAAGELGIEYAGLVTTLDPNAFFRGAVEVRRGQFPDLVVTQPYLPVTPRLPGILSYTVKGTKMTDLVYLQSLPPGHRLLMVTESFPTNMAAMARHQAEYALHLESPGVSDSPSEDAAGLDPQSVVTRLLAMPPSVSDLPRGYEIHGVARTNPETTDVWAIARIEVDLGSKPGRAVLAFLVYPSAAEAEQAYGARLIDKRIGLGAQMTPVTGMADEAALIVIRGSTAVGQGTATSASVLVRQGNVLISATASNRDVLDPAAATAAAYSLALAGVTHLQQVLPVAHRDGALVVARALVQQGDSVAPAALIVGVEQRVVAVAE